jgi:glycosyltransferase involved in cell wall biosynthesis
MESTELTLSLTRSSPRVSVLLPAYNHARYVKRSLDSVLEDSYPNTQLVIINDGSSDGTHEVISDWLAAHRQDVAVQYINRENRGISATMNEMAAIADGDFLRVGASDDYLLPGGNAVLAGYLTANPSKLAVFGDAIVVDDEDAVTATSSLSQLNRARKKNFATDAGLRRELIRRWSLAGPTMMLRKEALLAVKGWSEDLRVEDWSFYLRLASRDALGFVDATVGVYRVHGGNMSRTRQTERRIRNLQDFAVTALRHVPDFAEPDRSFLRAQSSLVAAKIAYLRRQPIRMALNLAAYAGRTAFAQARAWI